MTNSSLAALVGVGFFAILLIGGLSWYVGTDSDADLGARVAGAGIGAALGMVNLLVGIPLTLRAMRSDTRNGTTALLRVIVGGFLINLTLVVALTVVFHGMQSVNQIAFALTYVTFFFIFDGIKVVMVEKSLRRAS